MHEQTIGTLTHPHQGGAVKMDNEKRTLQVLILTAVTMLAEIIAGTMTGSMALLADGWHMGTHAFALGISYAAYLLARRLAGSARFAFGTGKFGVLAGYTSSLFLGAAALFMIGESVSRFFHPLQIAFDQAIIVSLIGFIVNAASIWILQDHHDHHHGHDHEHAHDHEHGHGQDHNYRAVYFHVIADALTSVLAIAALLAGKFLGLSFLDPLMGIVGGLLICKWAYGLISGTAFILLDGSNPDVSESIRTAIEADGDSKVADLHVWRLDSDEMAAVVSVVSGKGKIPADYRLALQGIPHLHHWTVEVHPCQDAACACLSN